MEQHLPDWILHCNAADATETSPLSADVYAIRGKSAWWIFDVGANDAAVNFINSLNKNLPKNVILSHFHHDHAGNLSQISWNQLYVGKETWKHVHAGNVIENLFELDDGLHIQIAPIPNSHAKGSLIFMAAEYAFLGDANYPMVGHGKPDAYNVQQLFSQIQFLKNLNAKYFLISHKRFIAREKFSVLQFLENVYAQRKPNENWILCDEK